MARYNAECPSHVNPAEFMLDAIGAGITPRIGDRDWAEIWLDSPEYRQMLAEIDAIKKRGLARPAEEKANVLTCKPVPAPGHIVAMVNHTCRRDAILVPAASRFKADNFGSMALTRLRIHSTLRPLVHLPVRLAALSHARPRRSRSPIPRILSVSYGYLNWRVPILTIF
jgi:hypothetical protein